MRTLIMLVLVVAMASAQVFMDISGTMPVDGEEVQPRLLVDVSEAAGPWAYSVGMGYRPPASADGFDPTITVQVGVSRQMASWAAAYFKMTDIPLHSENHTLHSSARIGVLIRL
jgi:hypothetical protein